MQNIIQLDSIAMYNQIRGLETLHPLVSVYNMADAKPLPEGRYNFGLYTIFFKELKCGELHYGRKLYDYQEGTLVCISPGQILGVQRKNADFNPKGWALSFHPELIKGTALGKHIQDYSFFSYDADEALHVSEKEKQLLLDCFAKIRYELEQAIDKHSRTLITSNIELLLNYCLRFYDRQFITRDNVNKGLVERFEALLNGYFQSNKPETEGLPSVAWCAAELNLSANYFGDMIRKETGRSAHEYIHLKIMDVAKERIFDTGRSVSQIAYQLGFKYPQHFTRFFKQQTGQTPNEYRMIN
ncbi:helix-turn-helix domain-containing protein [Mucilaginibacter sp. UR6-1]|uniref:helix-turn-helix domain-containing protein n=1 Tax=Mucilaginibacter sp. UR6-1 TaxID=1435643 RepID=UPI001E45DBDF|nr:helix-turn-helix domain-containing protein [Mucilaginibacter sp. UR6-1]MCC8409176.1 helix-turn-helix domain-containing protein [Mucilaginibacter sp. UR6-1]